MEKPYKTGDERRHSTMSFRVSRTQRQHIEKLADECGMNLSGYLISRAYGYRPKARLTRAQENVRDELIIARSDYAKYTSMLNAMPQKERLAMFRNQPWMTEALRRLDRVAELITDVINRYFSPSNIPGADTETHNNT